MQLVFVSLQLLLQILTNVLVVMVDVITSVLITYLDLSAPAGRGMSWTAMELHVMVSGWCYIYFYYVYVHAIMHTMYIICCCM